MLKQSFISSEPYLLTHPLGQWRLDHIYSYKYQDDNENNFTQSQLERFKRAVYKLRAYTYPPDTILAKYNGNDFISYYARVIAIFRKGQKQEAENKINLLVSDYPKDPYLLEIKGQIFMENGDFTTSTKTYKEALRYEPSSNLLKFQLAVSEINLASKTNDETLLKNSILLLNQIIDTNDQTSMTYHYLSVAYGKLGDIGNAKLALAEKFFLLDKKPETEKFANQALKYLKPGSSSYIRANDLLNDLKHNK
jgi:predicted Zn-dependent protease